MAGQKPKSRPGGPKVHNGKGKAQGGHNAHGGSSKFKNIPSEEHQNKKRKREEKQSAQRATGDSSQLQPSKKTKTNGPASTADALSSTSTPITAIPLVPATSKAAPNPDVSLEPSQPLTTLTTTHALHPTTIITSSSIQKKVRLVLETLSVYPAVPPDKPRVMVLEARANTASKLITVVEIAKREIKKLGGVWFQYSRVEGVVEERKKEEVGRGGGKEGGKGKEGKGEGAGEGEGSKVGEDGEVEDEGFETMKTPFERAIEGTAKVRAIPVMTVYLSRIRIESLRKLYGEQTNAKT